MSDTLKLKVVSQDTIRLQVPTRETIRLKVPNSATFAATALAQATAAAASATAAATSAMAAATAETNAETAETNAEAAEALAEQWAFKTDGIVDATDYSSKAWAVGGTGVTDTASRGAAKEWAINPEDETVDGTNFSALHWAAKAEASAASVGALNGLTDVVLTTPADNELLAFDNASGDWINRTAVEAGLVTADSTNTFTNKTFDANGTGNSITNIETADIASTSKTGADADLVTGTAGSNTHAAIWNTDGDLVSAGAAPYVVGGTDVPVTDGGTGASTAEGAASNLGLGTEDSPQFTGIELGHATDTTITRASAGRVEIEGSPIVLSDDTVLNVIALTQATYDGLTPTATTLYLITDA